jgi:hypothetical protein
MILKILSPKKLGKFLAFLTQRTASLYKNKINYWFLRKYHFYRPKLEKIAEDCDHNFNQRKEHH